jgi:glycine/D-amino acid oxidase-like deaminating enzyme
MIRPKILIAGAGVGGLATACCLLKRGFDVEVYEQAPALSEVGAGIQISANAMHVLRYLGLGDAILRVGVQPKAYVFRLHDTGEVIQTFALSEEHRRQHGRTSSCIVPTCTICSSSRRASSSRASCISIARWLASSSAMAQWSSILRKARLRAATC